MRRTLRCRKSLAAGAALLLAGVTFATGAAPAVAGGTVRVMHFNICGAACNHGVIDKAGPGNDVIDDVRSRVISFRPTIMTLNEVCVGQFKRLQRTLGGGAWNMAGTFRAQRNDGRCRDGAGFGDAVFTAERITARKVLPLPNPPGGEHRAILCVRTAAAGGPVLACVMHAVTGDPMRSRQVAATAQAANAEAGRGAVILGGDFNTRPAGMRALLDPDRGGRFFDVDPEHAPTRGDKIDYVLFGRRHFKSPSGGPQRSPRSDHKVLLGQATRA